MGIVHKYLNYQCDAKLKISPKQNNKQFHNFPLILSGFISRCNYLNNKDATDLIFSLNDSGHADAFKHSDSHVALEHCHTSFS